MVEKMQISSVNYKNLSSGVLVACGHKMRAKITHESTKSVSIENLSSQKLDR